MKIIKKITNNTSVYVQSEEQPIFAFTKLNLEKYLDQVTCFKDITELEEKIRLIDFADRFVFFDRWKNGIDFEQLSHEDVQYILKLYGFNKDFSLYQSFDHSYVSLRTAFYALFMGLDALRYRSDKKTRAVISGTHDWEHLLYASNARVFVTEDKRLRKRAQVIYRTFNYPTKVLSMDKFLNSEWN